MCYIGCFEKFLDDLYYEPLPWFMILIMVTFQEPNLQAKIKNVTGAYLIMLVYRCLLTIMDNGNDLLTPNSEFSDEKQKIIKQWPNYYFLVSKGYSKIEKESCAKT